MLRTRFKNQSSKAQTRCLWKHLGCSQNLWVGGRIGTGGFTCKNVLWDCSRKHPCSCPCWAEIAKSCHPCGGVTRHCWCPESWTLLLSTSPGNGCPIRPPSSYHQYQNGRGWHLSGQLQSHAYVLSKEIVPGWDWTLNAGNTPNTVNWLDWWNNGPPERSAS